MTIRITVVIPTYNRAPSLERTLGALEDQDLTPVDWSALVVDNNSTDDTAAVVQRYQERQRIPRLRYVREAQQGASHARRRGAVETESELIAYVDDDCLLQSDWLRQAVAFYDAHSRAGAVGGRIAVLWEESPPEVARSRPVCYGQQELGGADLRLPGIGETGLFGAGVVMRRIALQESGWLERLTLSDRKADALSAGGDIEMVLRIRQAGYELWYTPKLYLQHWIPPQQTTVRYLCRRNRENGRPYLILHAMAEGRVPPLSQRLRILGHRILSLAKLSLWTLGRDVLLRRSLSLDEWRIRWSLAFGHLEGASAFLLRDVEI